MSAARRLRRRLARAQPDGARLVRDDGVDTGIRSHTVVIERRHSLACGAPVRDCTCGAVARVRRAGDIPPDELGWLLGQGESRRRRLLGAMN